MISLQVKGLAKSYNRLVIFEQLSFLHSDGVLGIAGTNGSGKSTLLKCLASLARPKKGTIRWMEGEHELSSEEIRPRVGYAAPYINLYDELTIFENLEFLLEVSGLAAHLTNINSRIDQVQMKPFRNKLFKSLSTGQRQRVKLAAALIRQPDVVFLDEPGSNLDESGQALVSQIVSVLKAKNKLVIIASNDPREIAMCDQVIQL